MPDDAAGREENARPAHDCAAGVGRMDATAAVAHLHEAVGIASSALDSCVDDDWTRTVVGLDWTVEHAVYHAAGALYRYAVRLALQSQSQPLPFSLGVEEGAGNRGLVDLMRAGGVLLGAVVATASPDVRAFHNYGISDPIGFAAMGVVESLVHSRDVALTFGHSFELPAAPAAFAIARLFPDAPYGEAADVLLWCTGREPLGDRPRQDDWQWDSTVRP
jgi:hypothetical protein